MELAERSGSPLYVLLLDWSKAFDKISHDGLLHALHRMGINSDFTDLIGQIYKEPKFTVRVQANDISTEKTASSGIRQGCPLSPYLFTILHTVIMHDVEQELLQKYPMGTHVHSASDPLFDLGYADDTLLLGREKEVVETALHSLQRIAENFNLQLNFGKCEMLRINAHNDVHFHHTPDELQQLHTSLSTQFPKATPHLLSQKLDKLTKVRVVQHAKYLGVTLNADTSSSTDVINRCWKAREGFKKLSKFWTHASLPTHWKLLVFKQTFLPMLLYGMDSANLTEKDIHRMETLYHRSLRTILGIKSTYYSKKINTNPHHTATTHEQARKQANFVFLKHKQTFNGSDRDPLNTVPQSKTEPFPIITNMIRAARLKILGHVLRAPQDDLMRSVSFDTSKKLRVMSEKCRKGHPRNRWLLTACTDAHHVHNSVFAPNLPPQPFYYPISLLPLHVLSQNREAWHNMARCLHAQNQTPPTVISTGGLQ